MHNLHHLLVVVVCCRNTSLKSYPGLNFTSCTQTKIVTDELSTLTKHFNMDDIDYMQSSVDLRHWVSGSMRQWVEQASSVIWCQLSTCLQYCSDNKEGKTFCWLSSDYQRDQKEPDTLISHNKLNVFWKFASHWTRQASYHDHIAEGGMYTFLRRNQWKDCSKYSCLSSVVPMWSGVARWCERVSVYWVTNFSVKYLAKNQILTCWWNLQNLETLIENYSVTTLQLLGQV